MKTQSTHALAAKAIRQELKSEFPNIKFSVKSDSFVGGDSVRIEWINGPSSDQVNFLTKKYQYGSFDCQQDLYESNNRHKDFPQVKYVQSTRKVCESLQIEIFEWLKKNYANFENAMDLDTYCLDLRSHWNISSAREMVYRLTVDKDLTQGYLYER